MALPEKVGTFTEGDTLPPSSIDHTYVPPLPSPDTDNGWEDPTELPSPPGEKQTEIVKDESKQDTEPVTPTETSTDKSGTLDDFFKLKGQKKDTNKSLPKTEEKVTEEESKEDDGEERTAKFQKKQAEPVKEPEVAQPEKGGTQDNYDDIPILKETFKKMDKTIHPRIAKEIRRLTAEAEDLKTKVGKPSFYDHEHGYLLSPQFSEAVQTKNFYDGFHSHWKEQLAKIHRGEKWEDIVQQDGKLYKVEKEADGGSVSEVTSKLIDAKNSRDQAANQAHAIQQGFAGERTARIQRAGQMEDRFFPQYKGTEVLKSNPDMTKTLKVLEEVGEGGNVLNPFLAKLYAFAMETLDKLEEAEGKLSNKTETAREQKLAGVNSGVLNPGRTSDITGNGDPSKIPFSMDDFRKIKNG